MMDEEPDRRQEGRASRRALKTRQRLLDAALYIFNTKGVESCAIEDITESADVGKGTFYRHFMDKLDILRSLLDFATDDLIRRMPPENSQAISLEDRATQLMHAHQTFFSERSDLYLLFLQGQTMVATRPAAVPGIQAPFARYIAALESRLESTLPQPAQPDRRRQLALLLAAAACGPVTAGLSISSSKHDVVQALDVARQSLLAGASKIFLK